MNIRINSTLTGETRVMIEGTLKEVAKLRDFDLYYHLEKVGETITIVQTKQEVAPPTPEDPLAPLHAEVANEAF